MELYIRIKDGKPFEHPILGSNFRQAFPNIDTNNLPPEFAKFVRVEPPIAGLYKVLEPATYEFLDGVWTDVFQERDMTTEEKTAAQQEVITAFNNRNYSTNWSAWTLDEATNTMVPPIPRPDIDQTKIEAGIYTFWCGADANWKDTPARPEGEYMFNFFAWQWVEITL